MFKSQYLKSLKTLNNEIKSFIEIGYKKFTKIKISFDK